MGTIPGERCSMNAVQWTLFTSVCDGILARSSPSNTARVCKSYTINRQVLPIYCWFHQIKALAPDSFSFFDSFTTMQSCWSIAWYRWSRTRRTGRASKFWFERRIQSIGFKSTPLTSTERRSLILSATLFEIIWNHSKSFEKSLCWRENR